MWLRRSLVRGLSLIGLSLKQKRNHHRSVPDTAKKSRSVSKFSRQKTIRGREQKKVKREVIIIRSIMKSISNSVMRKRRRETKKTSEVCWAAYIFGSHFQFLAI
ncbi:hypothetical protein ABFS83_05G125700 [Erythranthe nasuta]